MKQRGIESYMRPGVPAIQTDVALVARLETEKQRCRDAEAVILERERAYLSDPTCAMFADQDVAVDQNPIVAELRKRNKRLEEKIAEMGGKERPAIDPDLQMRLRVGEAFFRSQDEFVRSRNIEAIRARRIAMEKEIENAKREYERCTQQYEELMVALVQLRSNKVNKV